VFTLNEGASAIGPHVRQEKKEIGGLRSIYTVNMAGFKSAPLTSSESLKFA
jgi:hypothetical protein